MLSYQFYHFIMHFLIPPVAAVVYYVVRSDCKSVYPCLLQNAKRATRWSPCWSESTSGRAPPRRPPTGEAVLSDSSCIQLLITFIPILPQVLGSHLRGLEGQPDPLLQGPEVLPLRALRHVQGRTSGGAGRRHFRGRPRLHQEEARLQAEVSGFCQVCA